MRLAPTIPAAAKKAGARRGAATDRTAAPAKDDAVCPLGNDHEPGFFPTTTARITSTNGRRRRKNALIGYSAMKVVPNTQAVPSIIPGPLTSPSSRATASPPSQIQPPRKANVTTWVGRRRARGLGDGAIAGAGLGGGALGLLLLGRPGG